MGSSLELLSEKLVLAVVAKVHPKMPSASVLWQPLAGLLCYKVPLGIQTDCKEDSPWSVGQSAVLQASPYELKQPLLIVIPEMCCGRSEPPASAFL